MMKRYPKTSSTLATLDRSRRRAAPLATRPRRLDERPTHRRTDGPATGPRSALLRCSDARLEQA